MISLSRHIELLLLEHNCVIVPGLGGFIANTASAVYNDGPEGDKLFIPPYRTIGFNPQLQVNDGLLVQSYMQAYDASYPAAYLQMEKEVEQLNMQLNLFGEYNLEGIGTLHKSLGQNIILTSPEAGILTPSLYGTYSFGIRSLAEVVREREILNAANQANIMPIQTETDLRLDSNNEGPEAPVIPIKRKDRKKKNRGGNRNIWAELGVAASVAAIIFLVWLIPNTVTMNGNKETVIAGAYPNVENTNTAKITGKNGGVQNAEAKTEKKSTTKKVETIVEPKSENKTATKVESTTTTKVETKDESKKTTKPDVKPVEKNYTIVLASFVTEKNSNILIEKLASLGLTEGKFIQKGKTTRVIYSAYATEQEAIDALLSLRQQNEAFKDAWTLKMD